MPETKFQTSFIPKQPVTGGETRHSGGSSIFFLVSFLILVATAAAGVGAYVWHSTIEKQIEKGNTQLKTHRSSFDKNTIEQFTRLDNRIDVASTLLKNHVSASSIFPRLQDGTLKTVQFKSFSYANSGDGKIVISMTGEAQDYESLALQATEFTESRFQNSFRSPIFSSFTKGKSNVVFTFSSGIDPFILKYYDARQTEINKAETGQPAAGATTEVPASPNPTN